MDPLRQIPPVNDILRADELSQIRSLLHQPFVTVLLNEILGEVRLELQGHGSSVTRPELTRRIASQLACRVGEAIEPSLRRVINASGVVLHTNLGRAPLPSPALDHLRDVSGSYSNLEFDLDTGGRGKRDFHVEQVLRRLLGCEAAIVVNNNAAAVLLVLNTLAEGGEVVASRGEQVEIGGAFRIPDVMTKSGAKLREVGTTNRTRIGDYERAINENTRLLLRVHPSNFRIVGFTERPALEEFVRLGQRRNVPTFEDLGSGCLVNMAPLGVRNEPVAAESIRMGVDVLSFSGDKLLGGPQAGIIAGRRSVVDRVRENSLYRALRVDKLTYSVLEAVLLAYLRGEHAQLPSWRMLLASEEELKERAEAFALRAGSGAWPVRLTSVVGGGSAPESYLPSWGVTFELPALAPEHLEERLRKSTPPVIVRVEDNRIVLDFRTIAKHEEEELLTVLRQCSLPAGERGAKRRVRKRK